MKKFDQKFYEDFMNRNGILKLKQLAERLEASSPKIANSLNEIILSIITKGEGTSFQIEVYLSSAVQHYYQIIIDQSGFSKDHWISTLKTHLSNIVKASSAPKYRDRFFLDDDQINQIINRVNEDSFIEAFEHLNIELVPEEGYPKFFKDNLKIKDLFQMVGETKPSWIRKYKR